MEEIRQVTTAADWAQTTALLLDYLEWFRAATGRDLSVEQRGLAAELDALPARYDGTDRVMFLATLDALAIGTLGVGFHPDGTAELKRMYVRPIGRGRGVADRLVQAAIDEATRRGVGVVWLETMRGLMDPAIAVYERCGFAVVDEGGRTLGFDGVVTMERHLEVLARTG